MKGFSLGMFDTYVRQYLKRIVALSSDNYPEVCGGARWCGVGWSVG